MTINCPDDFDDGDVAFADQFVPDGAVVTSLTAVVAWIDPETGERRWWPYIAGGVSAVEHIGLLDLVKQMLVAHELQTANAFDEDDD